MALAQQAGIDAFALNMAAGDTSDANSISNAFQAANQKGFKLFFSFDYAAWGAWDKNTVISYINQYKNDGAYWKQGSQPLVSTFEGTGNVGDWASIKSATGCFFMPEWSSMGAQAAANTGVVDGLFSWDAWPNGATDMNTGDDQSYKNALGGKPYMMPVSPWFYTNLPGWTKNWLWRGDDLWYDRWQQVLDLQPEMVEIISWNDYGESHYIGPLHDSEFGLFTSGGAPFNYVAGMPHDGWRQFLPYVISQYKTGSATISQEGLTAWYRVNPNNACNTGGTTGNDAGHGQTVMAPTAIAQDKVFYSALLSSSASVTVSIGGVAQTGSWAHTPNGGSGIYHGSVPMNGHTGPVVITISRNGNTISQINGASITTSCTNGIQNWNAWVGSSGGASSGGGSSGGGSGSGSGSGSGTCNGGTGTGNYGGLCSYACNHGYCPSPCTCTSYGTPAKEDPITGQAGYPLVGLGCGYAGLCSYSCNHGYCPSTACGSDPAGAQGC
jgi:hypothetical protein